MGLEEEIKAYGEHWKKANVGVSMPTPVAGGYPRPILDAGDIEILGTAYTEAALTLLRGSDCELLPTVYLHLTKNPFSGEPEDALYEMHVEDNQDLPDILVQNSFETLVRMTATKGACIGTVLIMRAIASLNSPDAEPGEVVLVRIELKDQHRTWLAPYWPCRDHGLHHGEFHAVQKLIGGSFGSLMKPMVLTDMEAGSALDPAERKALIARVAEQLGFSKIMGGVDFVKLVNEVNEQVEQDKEKPRG